MRQAWLATISASGGLALAVLIATSRAAEPARSLPAPQIPTLFDPNLRLQKPEPGAIKQIRFVTSDDFPPFHFALTDGTLAGFDIDLARAICADLKVVCTIQARRFDGLTTALGKGEADALIAAIANTPATRESLAFTAPYYTTPGRFVAKTDAPGDATPEALSGRSIGVQAGTAHEAFLKAFFAKSQIKPAKDQQALRAALQQGSVDAIFGDAIALSLWLNGTEANQCCAFRGGPFTESVFFGSGVSIAVARDNMILRQALDYELAQMTKTGVTADLYLKYFPIGFY